MLEGTFKGCNMRALCTIAYLGFGFLAMAMSTPDAQRISEVEKVRCSHHLQVDFWEEESASQSNLLLENVSFSGFPKDIIHQVTVTGSPTHGNWTLLAEVFETLTDLKTIKWDADKVIPKAILEYLDRKHPIPRLYYTPAFADYD